MTAWVKLDQAVEAQRRRHARRTALGVCVRHPGRPAVTKTLCVECRDALHARYQARKQNSATVCVRGNHPNDQPERSVNCRACTAAIVAYYATPKGRRAKSRWHRQHRRRAAPARTRRPWTHGRNGYMNHRCRCATCRRGHARYTADRRNRKAEGYAVERSARPVGNAEMRKLLDPVLAELPDAALPSMRA